MLTRHGWLQPAQRRSDEPPEPLEAQKTCYEVNGVTLSVDGFAYARIPRGGNPPAHGKATGEAFWPASRLLMDHLAWDCEWLKGRRAATRRRAWLRPRPGRLGRGDDARTTKGGERLAIIIASTPTTTSARRCRFKESSTARARASARSARGHTAPVSCVEHRWGEPHALGRFDVVLAGRRSCTSERCGARILQRLAKSCDSLPGADGGVVLVAFERRGVELQVPIDAFAAFS